VEILAEQAKDGVIDRKNAVDFFEVKLPVPKGSRKQRTKFIDGNRVGNFYRRRLVEWDADLVNWQQHYRELKEKCNNKRQQEQNQQHAVEPAQQHVDATSSTSTGSQQHQNTSSSSSSGQHATYTMMPCDPGQELVPSSYNYVGNSQNIMWGQPVHGYYTMVPCYVVPGVPYNYQPEGGQQN